MAVTWHDDQQLCAPVTTSSVGLTTSGRGADSPRDLPDTEALCREYQRLEAVYKATGDRPSVLQVLDWTLECPTQIGRAHV